eukprot:TRINITY_DN3107_c0_g1_i6.p1 TRINITY_DN3107_c0_g1~~TRINITY_DN3107_c0_g1_i6.p1  ORF type:complete len:503 (+),score=82.94 TRINITY_DN3107_c0_g1_i6:313-1821(+)
MPRVDPKDSVEVPNMQTPGFSWKKLWLFMGPGFFMSIAYIDPGNLESDVQAGALTGYQLLWVMFWSTVVGLILQMLSVKLSVVTGRNLAEQCRLRFRRPVRIVLWLMTELAIIGSDIQEVVGSAIAIYILSGSKIPIWAGVLITAADTFVFLLLGSYGVRKLEGLFSVLVGVMGITFATEYIISKPDQVQVIEGLIIPRLSSGNLYAAMGLLGAIIMPHNLYLHSALVQTRKIDHSNKIEVQTAQKYYFIESAIALFVSMLINLFVVSVFAKGFYGVPDADSIGLLTAGHYLRDKYGETALYIWAIGLLAAGQSSTMTGTYAGQVVMMGFLDLKISAWKRQLLTRGIAIIPSVIVAAASTANLDALDEWLNVLQSVQLPFALLPLLYLTSDEITMGSYFVSSGWTKAGYTFLALSLIGINLYFVIEFAYSSFAHSQIWIYILVGVIGFGYVGLLFYLLYKIACTTFSSLRRFSRDEYADTERTRLINEDDDETETRAHGMGA